VAARSTRLPLRTCHRSGPCSNSADWIFWSSMNWGICRWRQPDLPIPIGWRPVNQGIARAPPMRQSPIQVLMCLAVPQVRQSLVSGCFLTGCDFLPSTGSRVRRRALWRGSMWSTRCRAAVAAVTTRSAMLPPPRAWQRLAHIQPVICARPEIAYAVRCLTLFDQVELTIGLLSDGDKSKAELPPNVVGSPACEPLNGCRSVGNS
jgi:hypothetical protein